MILIDNTVLSNFALAGKLGLLETGNKILEEFIKYGYFSPIDKLDEFL